MLADLLHESALRRVLLGLGRRPVLVVTDRYPPHAHGGAEVSLHIGLQSLGAKDDILVVSFGDGSVTPSRYSIDGISVLQLPRQGAWPNHRLPRRLAANIGRVPSRALPLARRVLESGSQPTHSDGALAIERALRGGARPRGGAVIDFLEYPGGLGAELLRRVMAHVKPEIVHADNYRSILLASEASQGMPVRRIGVVRDNRFHCVRYDQSVQVSGRRCNGCDFACAEQDLREQPELQRDMLQRSANLRQGALRQLDRVVVTSDYLRREVAPLLGGEERIVQIPNTPDAYEVAREAMVGVAELPGTNLLVVGMLNENKGQLPLVRSLDALVARVPDVTLHFAGRGPRIEAKIRELANERDWSDRLVFHGYVDREGLYVLYRRCQIVALPTVWPEPFGRVPLEAGLARRPVVSFAVGGLRESIEHGETGYLIPPGDSTAFVAAVGRLADDPEWARAMGRRAYDHIVTRYQVRDMRKRITEMWAEERAAARRRS